MSKIDLTDAEKGALVGHLKKLVGSWWNGRRQRKSRVLFQPECKECGLRCASIEIIAPDALPVEWAAWPQDRREAFARYRVASSHCLLYEGPGGSNGRVGDPISPERAAAVLAAIANPIPETLKACGFYDGAGLCTECREFYCPDHWSISATGYGVCPRGHGKSLDPHWHP
ncbi:MAG TPA: hypothetical protein VNF49_04380 [Candidatus Binataceae bacterium]|nr:hypothetical protein [Candidatus Binataceae bacterium]